MRAPVICAKGCNPYELSRTSQCSENAIPTVWLFGAREPDQLARPSTRVGPAMLHEGGPRARQPAACRADESLFMEAIILKMHLRLGVAAAAIGHDPARGLKSLNAKSSSVAQLPLAYQNLDEDGRNLHQYPRGDHDDAT